MSQIKLSKRQRAFVDEYLRSGNASKAAAAAGYGKSGAGTQGHRLLKNVQIARALRNEQSLELEVARLKRDDVLREIRTLAFNDLTEAFYEDGTMKPFREMSPELRRAFVAFEMDENWVGRGDDRRMIGYTKKFRIADKVKALEMLARHFKLLTDRVEHSGHDGAPIAFIALPPNGSEAVGFVSPQNVLPEISPSTTHHDETTKSKGEALEPLAVENESGTKKK